jgi:putative transposase
LFQGVREKTMSRGPKPISIELSDEIKAQLVKLERRPSTPQQIAQRARMILRASEGQNNAQIGRELGIVTDAVRKWRGRWAEFQTRPVEEVSIEVRLSDRPRSGAPGKFSAEQMAQIIALACEAPQASGYPVSHWTPHEVAAEAIKRGIVASISPRQVGRFLK